MIENIEKEWSTKLNRKVKINATKQGKGKITLSYQSLGELQSLLNTIENNFEHTEEVE